jgi:hypothetical protein
MRDKTGAFCGLRPPLVSTPPGFAGRLVSTSAFQLFLGVL